MATPNELGILLEQKRQEMAKLFADHTVEAGGEKQYNFTADELVEVNKRNEELAALGKQWETALEAKKIADENAAELAKLGQTREAPPANLPATLAQRKSLGQMFVESAAYKARQGENPLINMNLGIDYKTLMTAAAGFDPETQRTGRVVLDAQRQPIVQDLIPQDPTSFDTVRYMEETTFTNNAAAASEGGNLGEAALAYTERSQPVELVGTWLPITGQQLEDNPGIRALIDNRLGLMLAQAVENQIVNGTGATPQWGGFVNKPSVQTQAKGADPTPDAIRKAMTKVRVTGRANPTGVVIHPNDWQDIRLLRTADGLYIWGPPSEAGPERIWGLPIIETDVISENTALLGDFRMYSHLSYKSGVNVETTNSHASDFIAVKYAIRITMRGCLEIFRPEAFCLISGI